MAADGVVELVVQGGGFNFLGGGGEVAVPEESQFFFEGAWCKGVRVCGL